MINGVRNDINNSLNNLDSKIEKIEEKADNTYKHISGITIASISMAVATVLAIAALVVTLIIAK